MPQKAFTISLRTRLWLGIPLFPSDLGSKRCFCGQILDQFGDHLLGCGHNNLRIRRHDTLSDVLFHALLVDNANCRKEQRCSSDNSTRPGDVFHPDFDQGRPTYFDITVRNSLQPSYIVQAAHHAGVAAGAGEQEKDQHHEAQVTATGNVFHPLVCETFGLWSPHSLQVVKSIARRLSFRGNLQSARLPITFTNNYQSNYGYTMPR